MAINLSQIKDLLLPGLRGLTGKYEQIPRQWDKVFTRFNSEMALERTAEMRYLPVALLKTEGGQIKFDNNSGERYIFNQEHLEIAIGFAITRKAIDDNLYKTQFHPSNLGLQESFKQAEEIYGASVLNNATTYNASVGGDGVALLSTAHVCEHADHSSRIERSVTAERDDFDPHQLQGPGGPAHVLARSQAGGAADPGAGGDSLDQNRAAPRHRR